ncbi:helix-turn-helix transcriptional regulator [Pseudooceanicola algae]|uniref:Transcriptional activator protein AnoR n=1 Tax=Pseudooceanicola algae TaxID=1537215 RepID=A0A418SIN7_9RHOB|nr:autoinducer binding domain-containing protein [Pseudooceanicola algae]QPM91829.1 Transcriptional activator protein AnoR [Pseudooceanicola algae]
MTFQSNFHAELADSFSACVTADDSFAMMKKLAGEHGYLYFHYRQIHVGFDGSVSVTAYRSDMEREYQETLDRRRHLVADPLVRHCLLSDEPKLWSELEADYDSARLNDRHRAKIDLFREFGLTAGMTLRLQNMRSGRGRFMSGMSMVQEYRADPVAHDRAFDADAARILAIASHFSAHINPSDIARDHFRLNDREYDVLQLLAEGCQVQQIADRLDLADRTAAHHLSNMRRKLHATSNAHAVAIAMRIQLI